MNALPRRLKTIVYPIFGALLLALTVWGQPQPAQAAGQVGGYADLLAALQTAGATVTPAGDIDQPSIPVKGHLITVNGSDVQVFEFQDEAARQQVSDTISQVRNSIDASLPAGTDRSSFWATGRLIVLYFGDDQATINSLTKVLGNTITQASQAAEPPSQVTLVAQERLARALGVSAAQVHLASAEQADWPNTCLGMTPSGAACADTVTPGWRIIFNVNGQQYEVHTNETASVVRWQPEAGADTSISGLKSQATNVEKQLEKDAQQAGLKEELTKLEKEINDFSPQITQAWKDLQKQATIVWNELNRDVSQLSKNIQISGASK